jgi:hypothetical protein
MASRVRQHSAPRRSLVPWLALTVVLLGGYLATAATKSPAPPSPPRTADIQDTHDRLDRIYRKLGLRSDRPVGRDDEGCRCGRGRRAQPLPKHGPVKIATPAMPPFLGYLLLGVIIVAMLVPLYFALRRSYPSQDTAGQAAAEDEDEPGAEPTRQPWRVDISEARRLYDQGKLPEAFAALHRATLLALEQARQLSLDETVTNWEYVRRLSSKPELRDTLSAVTLAAEQSVLGKRPPDGSHFMTLEQRLLGMTWGDA